MAPSSPQYIWLKQNVSCNSRYLPSAFKNLPKCSSCHGRRGHAQTACLFNGFRRVYINPTSKSELETRVSFGSTGVLQVEPKFNRVFNRRLDRVTSRAILDKVTPLLLPMLEQEAEHAMGANVVRREKELDTRVICDFCGTGLFTEVSLCKHCGIELCQLCREEFLRCSDRPSIRPTQQDAFNSACHASATTRHELIPVSRFELSHIKESVSDIKLALPVSRPALPLSCTPSITTYPMLHDGSFDVAEFSSIWRLGVPVVVGGIERRLQGSWTPDDFIKDYGPQKVTPIDCTTCKPVKFPSTVETFFTFLKKPNSSDANSLKLKDWPPQKHFKDAYPVLFRAFNDSIPSACRDIVSVDGVLNLAAHLPSNAIRPDLGPKMYIACASRDDILGTTSLHLDVTDAINLMVWCYDQSHPAAIWHIFPADSVDGLRSYLRGIYSEYAAKDPINAQCFYLSDSMLDHLATEHNIKPWTVYQRVGEMVFIPAGCPHQVRNIQNAIKIACDFVSLHNLERTMALVQEQRRHRLQNEGPEDLLHIHLLLWYTWLSVSASTTASLEAYYHETADVLNNGDSDAVVLAGLCSGSSAVLVPSTKSDTTRKTVDSTETSSGSQEVIDSRELHKRTKIRAAHVRAAYGPRKHSPSRIYACPHPVCLGMFNRGGLLDHLKTWHPDIYDGTGALEAKLRKDRKLDVASFWTLLGTCYKIPPKDGVLLE